MCTQIPKISLYNIFRRIFGKNNWKYLVQCLGEKWKNIKKKIKLKVVDTTIFCFRSSCQKSREFISQSVKTKNVCIVVIVQWI